MKRPEISEDILEIQIINGPNLNLLGKRETSVYGDLTLDQIKDYTNNSTPKHVKLSWFQSNIEGEIIEKIQSLLKSNTELLVINPGGFSHTSVAIHDALKILNIPIYEVHLSNVYAREDFRHTLLTARAANTIMCGLGKDAYLTAIRAYLNKENA